MELKLIQTQRVLTIWIWHLLVGWSIWQDSWNVFVFVFTQTTVGIHTLYILMPCNLHYFCWRYIITEFLNQVLSSTVIGKSLVWWKSCIKKVLLRVFLLFLLINKVWYVFRLNFSESLLFNSFIFLGTCSWPAFSFTFCFKNRSVARPWLLWWTHFRQAWPGIDRQWCYLFFFNTVPFPRPSICTTSLISNSFAKVKLLASSEFIIDAILVAINKRNNTNSNAVNYGSQWESVQVLLHVCS